MKLKDQVAIVTGAGRNIGQEIAKLFAAEGAKVAVVDLDKPRGERVAGAIRAQGAEAELFVADVSKGSEVAAQGIGGRIVNIGSTSGFMGRSRAVAYSAAKGGVANLTRAMAAQLAPHNIRVNAIVPNKIGSPVGKDEFDPSRPVPNMVKRPGQPAEAARAVLFLVSEDSSFVYGANLFVDGGVSAMDLS
jgi:NAD(P)-dependent dehydrogenase (short-subunit alcohol dehydrogenase family)